jgi:hypothetical protein
MITGHNACLLVVALTWNVWGCFSASPADGCRDDVQCGAHQDTLFSCAVHFSPAGTDVFKTAGVMPPSAIGVKRLLLYRVDFSDFTGAAISSNAAAILIADLNQYYTAMSYGLMSFALAESGSVVTETLRLPEPSSAYDNNFTKFIEATRQVAAAAGYAPGEFDFDIICTGSKPGTFFGGIAYVGGPGMWIPNNNFNIGVVGHELGHNLGLPHASFWNTGDQSTIGPGFRQEYGDLFDSMGVPGGSASHFNTRFKHFLGWIPDNDAPIITTSGTYRIAAHDHPASSGRRALRLERNDSLNYWVEFRQSFNNRWVTNGASLRWSWSDRTNTMLLDTTLGTPSATQDSPILIGRTFSDSCNHWHITPVGKGGTFPESLDLVVNRGPFPGNVPPVAAIPTGDTTTSVGTSVTLQATASDGNGDALAYFWDFGDGNFGGNQASVQYSWAVAGEYVARCTVSDMKGGTASASIVVRVGTITTFVASGRVTTGGSPLEGVLVKAGARFSYTDSDGTFRITRLTGTRPIVTAVRERFNILNAGFENPIGAGANFAGLDFVALPDSLNALTLVATGAVWRFLDTGVAPTADWTGLTYDDTTWKAGPAKLGYGVGDEATPVSFGPSTSDRYLTTWFRRRFFVEDATLVDHLVFRLRRDDGAVVYLNGHEVYRENLPQGEVQPSTTAIADVAVGEEQTFFKRLVSSSTLASGSNVLAVEIHQFRTNSPDLSFDLELVGLSEEPGAFRPQLAVQRSNAQVQLSWPEAHPGWSVYAAESLGMSGLWSKSPLPVVSSSGWNNVFPLPTNTAGFYHLRKPDFCRPME